MKNRIWSYPIIVLGFVVILTNSCKKDDSDGATVIGNSYQGGKLAYVLQPDDPGYIAGQTHGLIAAPSDQGAGIPWSNNTSISIETGTDLGEGNANTNKIVASQGAGNYAAKLCYDLVLGGYSDWYLPSQDELNKLYLNKEAIGGFATYSNNAHIYWSSSIPGFPANVAIGQYFDEGGDSFGSIGPDGYGSVRAVRAF